MHNTKVYLISASTTPTSSPPPCICFHDVQTPRESPSVMIDPKTPSSYFFLSFCTSSLFSNLSASKHIYDSLTNKTQVLTTLHNLTASLFGIGAGILGLESYFGFLFYFFFSLLTSILVYAFRVRPGIIEEAQSGNASAGMQRYFRGGMELWTGGLIEGLSGFVLTWTLFYGLVRA